MGGNDYRENSETTQADRYSGNYAENDTGNENRRGTHRMQEHTGNENRRGTHRMQEYTGKSRAEEFERNRILKRTGMAFLGMSIAALIAISSMNSVSTVDTSDVAAEALEQGKSTELGGGNDNTHERPGDASQGLYHCSFFTEGYLGAANMGLCC